jgi:hypothetical protein
VACQIDTPLIFCFPSFFLVFFPLPLTFYLSSFLPPFLLIEDRLSSPLHRYDSFFLSSLLSSFLFFFFFFFFFFLIWGPEIAWLVRTWKDWLEAFETLVDGVLVVVDMVDFVVVVVVVTVVSGRSLKSSNCG